MRTPHDKQIIEHWLRLYNRLTGASYRVTAWPDSDSSKQNVDALCTNSSGVTLTIEHTLIEPFQNEKADTVRFMQTLAALENDPALCLQGYTCMASQPVGAIPNGVQWTDFLASLKSQLAIAIPKLPEGRSDVLVSVGSSSIKMSVNKMRTQFYEMGQFLTARQYPGPVGSQLIRNALERKLPKLAASQADRRFLLLEKDSIAGSIEQQYELVCNEIHIKSLRSGIDEIWAVNTSILESENVIFTNPIDPQEEDNRSFCSLNVKTGDFWQVSR